MHPHAGSLAHNPGGKKVKSPTFGSPRAPLLQMTMYWAQAQAAPPSPVALVFPASDDPPSPPTPSRRFERGTGDDPILLSPKKPKTRSFHLSHMDLTGA